MNPSPARRARGTQGVGAIPPNRFGAGKIALKDAILTAAAEGEQHLQEVGVVHDAVAVNVGVRVAAAESE
jgi:hypothetical protein